MKGHTVRNLLSVAVMLISISPLWIVDSALGALSITVLYDNAPFQEGLQPDWGFSCLIKIGEKEILLTPERTAGSYSPISTGLASI